ncbi:MAG: histone-like protein [Bacteroidota bacterium]
MAGRGKDATLILQHLNGDIIDRYQQNHALQTRDSIPRRLHRVGLRNIDRISKGSLKRMARRGGVKRMSDSCIPVIRNKLKEYLQAVLKDAVILVDHAKRKTVTVEDVVRAVRRQGKTLYGF